MNPVITQVTQRIIERSKPFRSDYMQRMQDAAASGPHRSSLSCGNLAHGFAACGEETKQALSREDRPNLAIVSAYNDMLSAHQPFQDYPAIIKQAAWDAGAVAQFAGGVPAMCDGVTQGQPGMELSLFSRDVIAMSTVVALSHNMFDAVACLGVCDKIVPGLLIGALSFGHLPTIFIPAGPMSTGISNDEKNRVRQLYAQGKVDRSELLASESRAYHSPGTCTFYGTANSNQLLMEFMGLHLPGGSFVNPGTELRDLLTAAATEQVLKNTLQQNNYIPLYEVITEQSVVNGLIGLMASGGSTNHTLHLIAIARAAGIIIDWNDFDDISSAIPLLARVYPNGSADVNHFAAAGGIQLMMRELLASGLMHEEVTTVVGAGMSNYLKEPFINSDQLEWKDSTSKSLDEKVVSSVTKPFSPNGGLRLLQGNLGRGVIKVSAVKAEHHIVEAPAMVFTDQDDVVESFRKLELQKDVVVVLINQGPRSNGMPELHKLTPSLGVLQDQGFKVALVTDGRMSGASGKVPAAIHMSPESSAGGPLSKIREGDIVRLDAVAGTLDLLISEAELQQRENMIVVNKASNSGFGREIFSQFRNIASPAEQGASSLYPELEA